MKKFFLVILLLLLCNSVGWGADVYIDPDWTGTETGAIATPYNSWDNYSQARGDTVYFKKGTVHRKGIIINVAASGSTLITLDAYGTGEKPIITSRVRITGTWTDEGGGVYSYAIPSTTTSPGVCWFGDGSDEWGTEYRQDTDTPSTPAEGKWGWVGDATDTIYWHPGASDPVPGVDNMFAEYTLQDRWNGGLISVPYVTIKNLHFARSGHIGLTTIGTSGTPISNVTWEDNEYSYNGNAYTDTIGNGANWGPWTSGCTDTGSIAHHNEDHGLSNEDLSVSQVGEAPQNNTFSNFSSYLNGECGVQSFGASGYLSSLTIENGHIYGNGTGGVAGANPENKAGIRFYYGQGTIKNCRIYDNAGSGIQLGTSGANHTGDGATATIQGNSIYNNGLGNLGTYFEHGISVVSSYGNKGAGSFGTVNLYHNTVKGASHQRGVNFYFDPLLTNIVAKNNIITGSEVYDINIDGNPADAGLTCSFDTNDYYGAGTAIIRQGYSVRTLSTWNGYAYVGTDLSTDPKVLSSGKLLPNSPCIDAGTWIIGVNDGGEEDPWGYGVYRLPNIGADQSAGVPKKVSGYLYNY